MPKFDASRFYKYDEIVAFLSAVEKEYPDLVTVSSIGKSHEGRDIMLATLTNKKTGADTEKPAYWIDANIHAGEVTGCTVALYTIWNYTANYGKDERMTRLLNDYAVYVVPRISVDGSELYLTTPHTLRSSTRRYPYDGRSRRPPPRRPRWRWAHTPDAYRRPQRHLACVGQRPAHHDQARADEFGGKYYSLITEGTINNWDEHEVSNAPMRYGLDLNRNFPFDWAPEGQQRGAGDYPFSEPETRAVAAFWTSHRNINGFVAYHTYSGVFLRPYSTHPDTHFATHDLEVFKIIGDARHRAYGLSCRVRLSQLRLRPQRAYAWRYGRLCVRLLRLVRLHLRALGRPHRGRSRYEPRLDRLDQAPPRRG